jgi:hypothetical protein
MTLVAERQTRYTNQTLRCRKWGRYRYVIDLLVGDEWVEMPGSSSDKQFAMSLLSRLARSRIHSSQPTGPAVGRCFPKKQKAAHGSGPSPGDDACKKEALHQ